MRRVLPWILLLSVLATTPAWARKWTSRSGGFSIEAELLDVRDGNAVLKKEDGTEVSVPLSKLSLSDIRYVDGILKSAEANVGAKPEPAPVAAPPATAPPPAAAATKPEPAIPSRSTASPAALRYHWKAGQAFGYHIKTEVQVGSGTEEIQAQVRYTVRAVNNDGIAEIAYTETITRKHAGETAATSGARYYVPAYIPHRPPSRYYPHYHISSAVAAIPPDVVKVDRYGRIVSMQGGVHFPLFLGRAAHFPFETLSPAEENPWTVATDVAFRLGGIDWIPTASLGTIRTEELPGRETSIYTRGAADARQITVAKTYEAATAAVVDGKPQIAMHGEGKLTYDVQRGLFTASMFKVRVTLHEGAVLVEVPLTVSYEIISEAEEAKIKADAEKFQREVQKNIEEMKRPLTVADLEPLVKDMESGDHQKAFQAKMRLTSHRNVAPDAKTLEALGALLNHKNAEVRDAAAEVFCKHATKENVPALMKLLDSESSNVRMNALRALGRLKATTAIDRIVQTLPKERFDAAQALREMGPAAEPAALKLLAQGNRETREQACQVLREVGTKKSLPALNKAAKDDDPIMKMHAESAIRAIQHRE